MNKLSKIFLVIIIILAIALGVITYYCFYWRDAYLSCANQMIEITQRLETIAKQDNRDSENVTLEIVKDSVTPNGATLIITDNNQQQYAWSEDYTIQVKENNAWKDLQLKQDVAFTTLAFLVDDNNQIKRQLNWSNLYGTLSSGTYRVQILIHNANEDIIFSSNEFEIK